MIFEMNALMLVLLFTTSVYGVHVYTRDFLIGKTVTFSFIYLHFVLPMLFISVFFVIIMKHIKNLLIELNSANEQLEISNAAKSRFLSTIGHEVRTPLNAIMGYGEILLEENLSTKKNLDDEQVDAIKTLLQCATSLLDSMNVILDYANLEFDAHHLYENEPLPQQQGYIEPFCFKKIVEQVKVVLHSKLNPQVEVFDSWKSSIENDQFICKSELSSIKSVIMHLISNAYKFTLEGSVEISCSRLESTSSSAAASNSSSSSAAASANSEFDTIEFKVTDTGVGIAEEHQSKMFTPFSQFGATTAAAFRRRNKTVKPTGSINRTPPISPASSSATSPSDQQQQQQQQKQQQEQLQQALNSQEHLQHEFEDSVSNNTRWFSGHGLGLTICKKIVSRLSGTIEYKSTLGKGTVFTVKLPILVRKQDLPQLINSVGDVRLTAASIQHVILTIPPQCKFNHHG